MPASKSVARKPCHQNRWVNLLISHDGSRKSRGVKLYFDGIPVTEPYVFKDALVGMLPPTLEILVGTKIRPTLQIVNEQDPDYLIKKPGKGLQAGQLDEIMFFNKALDEEEISALIKYDPIAILLAKAEKTELDRKRLFYHQLLHQDEYFQGLSEQLREFKLRKGRLDDIVLKPTMVMADMDTVRPTYVLERGQYDAPGEAVNAGTPLAVLAFDTSYVKNRTWISSMAI